MIGLVVVSHSRALAEAAVALAGEMVDGSHLPAIGVAAGLDATTFGTDAAAVAAAIGSVDGPDGVLVLLDLGSAVLSTEMALEFVADETARRVVVSSAPLVEGLVAAVVLASTGAPLDAVAEEAQRGLMGKQEHLDEVGEPAAAEGTAAAPDAAEHTATSHADSASADATAELEMVNPHGLHARPAARLVGLVRSFESTVSLTNLDTGRGPVDAASLSRVATLNARQGHRLRVEATGPDADAAVAALRALSERAFDDEEQAPPTRASGADSNRAGTGLDIAIGPAVVPRLHLDLSAYEAGTVDDELARSRRAVGAAAEAIGLIRDSTMSSVGEAEGEIFGAQMALLSDPALGETAEQAIGRGTSALDAWSDCLESLAAEFESLDDAYQRERAQDVRSVRRRVLAALTGQPDPEASQPDGSGVLVVPELDAATAAMLDTSVIVGVVTIRGGATGHGVIVAKSRGVPIITDVGVKAEGIEPGTVVAFDARSGSFVVAPDDSERRRFARQISDRTGRRASALARADEPASTSDGCRITVAANVISVDDAAAAASQGADGSGLVRTEILFGNDPTKPTVDRQVAVYRAVAAALGAKPITIRTWDVGGDKPLRFLPQPVEVNPFLGERGLRLFRRQPDVLREQLQAVCITARETPTKVMFPMVTTVEEVTWALEQLDAAARSATGGLPSGLEVGVMVEVPAAALRAGLLAARLDFVSIGTNDLTQYTVAADRGNAAVSGLVDGLDPAVLTLIATVCSQVPERVVVALCGDLASDPAVTALLIGLGVRELSSVAASVPSVKAAVRAVDLPAAEDLARQAAGLTNAADVRALLPAD